MPQFEQLKKGNSRVRVLSKDATRAYLLLMRETHGRMQVLPNDVYVIEDKHVQLLMDNNIEFEKLTSK